MARAYIVLARNDLDDSLLQVLDLNPNSSQLPRPSVNPAMGQTGYATHYLLDGVNNAVTLAGAGPITIQALTYGLSGYLVDTIENDASAGEALTAVQATNIAGDIEAAVAAGTALTAAAIDALIVTRSGGANGLTVGTSTGTVEEILRILGGERYRMPAGAEIETGGNAFVAARLGGFVTAPNVETPASVRTTHTAARALRGRSSTSPFPYIRPGQPRAGQTPVQTGTQDVNFNDVRTLVETGDVHLSATDGALSKLKAATFSFLNPAFTYNGGATPAQTIAAANVPATGVGRAVVVYDADGNVI